MNKILTWLGHVEEWEVKGYQQEWWTELSTRQISGQRSRMRMSLAAWVETNREAQMRPHVTQVKPPAVSLPPALCRDHFFFSSATRSDSKYCTEAMHFTCHSDLSYANVSSSFGSILHAFRLCFSDSLYLFCCPPWQHVPCSSWL